MLTKNVLKLVIFLPPSPNCWDCRRLGFILETGPRYVVLRCLKLTEILLLLPLKCWYSRGATMPGLVLVVNLLLMGDQLNEEKRLPSLSTLWSS